MNEIRQLRSDAGLTQKQLADLLEVSPNTVARWERGEMKYPRYLVIAVKAVTTKPP